MGDNDFQRLLFDYSRRCRERGVDPPYDFVAQEEGPRSSTAAADRDRLARHGLFTSGVWRLTEEGHRLAGELENRDVAVFAARLQRRTDASGAGVENQAPVGDYDPGEAVEDSGNPNGGLLATIGYERRSYEAYFNQLLGVGISRLCDVRRNPISRKWDSRSDSFLRAARSLASGMSPFRNWGSHPDTAPVFAVAQRMTDSLPATKPRLCRAVGMPWPESPGGSTRENGWRSPAMNAIQGTVTVHASPRQSSGPPPGPCCRDTCRTA